MGRECSFFIPFQQGAGRPANRRASIAAFRDPDKLEFKPRVLLTPENAIPTTYPNKYQLFLIGIFMTLAQCNQTRRPFCKTYVAGIAPTGELSDIVMINSEYMTPLTG
ncbi:hypothetical protein GX48_00960 [Paracoccidioides brasiliensis]|nr:hypothetical protein GX48_00960 [Paracoccidioides brasiliensis]